MTTLISNTHKARRVYRSAFEKKLMEELKHQGIKAQYEPFFMRYYPTQPKRYTPDIVLPNGIIIEAKGYFLPQDRTKHKNIKAAYPDLDVRLVFQRSSNKLSPNSQTTYADWCQREGFLYANRSIPQDWLNEPPSHKRLQAITAARAANQNQ